MLEPQFCDLWPIRDQWPRVIIGALYFVNSTLILCGSYMAAFKFQTFWSLSVAYVAFKFQTVPSKTCFQVFKKEHLTIIST